ncbi:unnamed protein product [Candida verbasci]|uniref:Uncharacterized protein n=1 Tax=Candida verbasci TaxID=1227364 RepID=A0A9W4XJH0_9ASCO|nr:unnamed protein product [Candida verbasci]
MDLYRILQVSSNSTLEEISRSYKKLALKYHPDKNNQDEQLTEKFKSITRAYEILKDPKKRSIYDRHGIQGLEGITTTESPKQQPTTRFRNDYDIFSSVFEDINSMFSRHHQSMFNQASNFPQFSTSNMKKHVEPLPKSTKVYTSDDIYHTTEVTLQDLYFGKIIKLSLPKSMKCQKCNGFGGLNPQTCRVCQGSGQVLITYFNQFSQMRQNETCSPCQGNGIYIAPQNKCLQCNGIGYIQDTKIISANVLPGSKNGDKIILKNESDEGRNVIPGDVILKIREKPHPEFMRDGNDLIKTIQIDLSVAIGGGPIFFNHLNGKFIKTIVEPTIQYDDIKIIEDYGMPIKQQPSLKGDLILKFQIKIPTLKEIPNLSKLIENLPKTKPVLPVDSEINEVVLTDPSSTRFKKRRIYDEI